MIVQELEEYLRETRVRHVHFGDGTTAPPPLAYVTNFPRLSLPLAGCHTMEIAQGGRTETIKPVRGHAVFVPDHAWNKPDWTGRVDVLTFLFGVKQIGISLVRHKGGSQVPPDCGESQRSRRLRRADPQYSFDSDGSGRGSLQRAHWRAFPLNPCCTPACGC